MKKLKQIWRYYFNTEIRALKKLKKALVYDYNHRLLDGMCLTTTYNKSLTDNDYSILMPIIRENRPEKVYGLYYFQAGELQPRLDWCDMVINKIMVQ